MILKIWHDEGWCFFEVPENVYITGKPEGSEVKLDPHDIDCIQQSFSSYEAPYTKYTLEKHAWRASGKNIIYFSQGYLLNNSGQTIEKFE